MRLFTAFLFSLSLFGQSVSQQVLISQKIAASGGTPTLITSGCLNYGASGGTLTLDTTGANFFVASTTTYTVGSAATISDSLNGGNFTSLTAQTQVFGVMRQALQYHTGVTGGGSDVFTLSGANSYPAVCIYAYSNMSGASVQMGTDLGTTSGASQVGTIQPGSVTASAHSVVCTGLSFDSPAGGITASVSGYSSTSYADTGVGSYGVGLACLVDVAGSTENPTWTMSNNEYLAVSIGVFNY